MIKHNAIILFAGLVSLVVPLAVWAQGGCGVCSGGGFCIPNPLNACTFQDLVEGIINFIFTIALGVAPIMIIVAGFLFVTGGGSTESVQKAKNILLYTVVGLFIIMISKGLIEVIKQFFAR